LKVGISRTAFQGILNDIFIAAPPTLQYGPDIKKDILR
jgi:hypothetical protein